MKFNFNITLIQFNANHSPAIFLLIIFLIFFSNNSFSQKDSTALEAKLKIEKNILARGNIIKQLLEIYLNTNEKKTRYYLDALRAPAIDSKDHELIKFYYSKIAYRAYTSFEYEKAILYFDSIYRTSKTHSDTAGMVSSLMNIGSVNFVLRRFDLSLAYYLQCTNYSENFTGHNKISSIKGNLGAVYREIGQPILALKNFEESLDECRKKRDTSGIIKALNNIGLVASGFNEYAKAEKAYREAIALALKINSLRDISDVYYNLANVVSANQKYDLALEYFTKSLNATNALGDEEWLAESYNSIAKIYFYKKDFVKWKEIIDKGFAIAIKYNSIHSLANLHSEMFNYYKLKNEPGKALEHFIKATQYRDSVKLSENSEKALSLKATFEAEQRHKFDSLITVKKEEIEHARTSEVLKRQKTYTIFSIVAVLLASLVALASYRAYKTKKKSNNELLAQQNIIEGKNKEILDSIHYAKRIQTTLLAHESLLNDNLNDYFILYKPKDIVSGDFYWAAKKDQSFYLAACDSTGHGVPGAFMSLLNVSFLNEAITEKNLGDCNKVLNHVRQRLIENISQDGGQDGMDCILLNFCKKDTLQFSGAHTSLTQIRNKNIHIFKTDKMPVGKGERMDPFSVQEIETKPGDYYYLHTDGFADQFGLSLEDKAQAEAVINSKNSSIKEINFAKTTLIKGKKFKAKRLQELFLKIHELPTDQQKITLENVFNEWKGKLEQVDDVCIIGFRI